MKAIAGISLIVPIGAGHATAQDNQLLAALGAEELACVVDVSDFTSLEGGANLARHGEKIKQVYFPVNGYASLIASDGSAAIQVALVGPEGLFGWESLAGRNRFLFDVYVPETVRALSLDVDLFRSLIGRNETWMKLHLDYLVGALDVAGRGVLCARFHTLEARLARFLLEVDDCHGHRHRQVPIHLTQSILAKLLGVRRSGVTNAATHLQLLGVINYRRGEIMILDRPGLERAACDCYRHLVEPQSV